MGIPRIAAVVGLVMLGLLSVAPAMAADCDVDKTIMASGDGLRLSYQLKPNEIRTGQPFAMTITVCGPDARPFTGTLQVDAVMPAHRHGMNYRPTVRRLEPGVYRADGMLFHMRGHWQFRFALGADNGTVRLAADHQQR